MKKTIFIISVLLLSFSSFLNAQRVSFSENPEEFIKDFSKYLSGSKKDVTKEASDQFEAYWESDLSSEQQKSVVYQTNKMARKGLRYSHFTKYIHAVTSVAESGGSLDEYLDVTTKVVDNENRRNIDNFLTISEWFLSDTISMIQKTNFNQTLVEGGSFKFEYLEPEKEKTDIELMMDKANQEEPKETETPSTEDAWDDWDSSEDDSWESSDEGSWEDLDFGDEENDPFEEQPVDQQPKTLTQEDKITDIGYVKPDLPKLKGPVITFTDVNLILQTKYDTAVVEKTSGSLMTNEKVFVGKGGTMDWRTAGMEPGECYVELPDWSFSTTGTSIEVEGVKLNYPSQSKDVLDGIFQYRSQNISPRKNASYPRFMSYHGGASFDQIADNLTLTGGFSMEGQRINTSSVDGEICKLVVTHENVTKFVAVGKRFDIIDSIIKSRSVGTIIFMGTDSLKQPSMSLEYNMNKHLLELNKGTRGSDIAPFEDTYHKVTIKAEKMDWYIDRPQIDFSIMTAKNHIPVEIESFNYYSDINYVRIQGLLRFHPIQTLVYYANKKRTNVVFVKDFAAAFKQQERTVASAMSMLSKKGFVSFNRKTGRIVVKDKAFFYVKCRRGRSDFDHITIKALAGARNASLNLEDNNLTLSGVKRFYINDSLNVYNEPKEGHVTIKKNRNMLMNGKLIAGKYFFVCDSMEFNYDRYEIQLNKIDSIQFKFTVDSTSESETHKEGDEKQLGLAVDYASGMLYIDKPDNKSSKKNNPGYPFFDAVTGARVHFSDDHVLGGVYGEDVYFHIPPFDIDSLNSVDPNNANFQGTFHSGGIFPEFEEVLSVRNDKNLSFGFIHEVPEAGYNIYGKNSKFYGKIDMSDFGMHGVGKIEHITSTLLSDDFIYFPDSVTTESGNKVDTRKEDYSSTSFPQMNVQNYKMRWLIVDDSMHLYNNDNPFSMYNNEATLDGRFTIRENGAFGQGIVNTNQAEAISNEFNFKKEHFTGRNAEFKVLSDEEGKPLVRLNDAKIDFNMTNYEALFGPEQEGYASTEFPFMQYKTSLSEGHFKMKEKIVIMKMEDGGNISSSYFYSTHPEQDSLVFNATNAICDLNKNKLDIFGVPYIVTADSKVLPDSGEVIIYENAELKTLHNAKLITDTIDEYHNLHSGEIDIFSRKFYDGSAIYDFVNRTNDTFQIKFDAFKLKPYTDRKRETRKYTFATAEILDDDNFYVSPRIQYRGTVELIARQEFLNFKGDVKLDLKSSDVSDYFSFTAENVDPNDIQVDLSNPVAEDGTPLLTGLFVNLDLNDIYAAFIALKENPSDLEIMTVKGALSYNPEINEFKLADTAKLSGRTKSGNLLALNDSTTDIHYEGQFNFVRNSKDFQMFSGGHGEGNINANKYEFNTITTIQYRLPGYLSRSLSDSIFKKTRDNYLAYDPTDIYLLENQLAHLVGDQTTDEITHAEDPNLPFFEYSSKFNKTFVLSDLDLNWHQEANAFYSSDTIRLVSMRKTSINSQVKGYFEIRKITGGDEVNFYLEPDSNTWYYFALRDNILFMVSSDYEFNKYVHKKSKIADRKEKEYVFGITDFVEVEEFKQNFKKQYLNQKADSINLDSLDIAYNNMIDQFLKESGKGIPEEEEEEEFDSDEGFEEIGLDDFIDSTGTTPSPDTEGGSKDEGADEDDKFENYSNEDLKEEFENSSLTGTSDKKKKKKKKKKDKNKKDEDKSKDTDNQEDDLGGFEEFDEDD